MHSRVAVIEYMHETNTFSILSTGMDSFFGGHYFLGNEIETQFMQTNSEIGGFLQAVDRFSWEPFFTVAANAEPGGVVSEEALSKISEEIISRLLDGGPFDGIYIAFHGAMVTETSHDGETQLLKKVRDVVGNCIPVAVTLDLHANVSDKMARYVDIAVSYRTYPHVDMAETAKEACDLLDRAMKGDINPAIEIARPPMLLGCNDGKTTNDGPMKHLLATVAKRSQEDGILSISINAGFPDADVEFAGPSVIVCYDKLTKTNDLEKKVATKFSSEIWDWRHNYDVPISLAACMKLLDKNKLIQHTVIIADYSDNPGSGAYSDCTTIIAALIEIDVKNAAAGALWDPEAVETLLKYGEGATVPITIGGKVDPSIGGGPIDVIGTISAIRDGDFIFEGPMYRGLPGHLGKCVCLSVGGLDILIVSERMQLLDKNIFRVVGIEPNEKTVLVVKSMQHFRAAFSGISENIIITDAGGLCTPNIVARKYKYVRRPVWPLDGEVDCTRTSLEFSGY